MVPGREFNPVRRFAVVLLEFLEIAPNTVGLLSPEYDFDRALDLYSESFFGAVSADEWRATLSGNRHAWGLPGNRSLIEADGLRNVLTGATIIALGGTVEYENRPVIERFTISWALLDHLEGIVFHEIAID